VHWRSISKDNVLTIYGQGAKSRIADPTDPKRRSRIFSWLICETRDDKGNAVIYEYRSEDGTLIDLTEAHERNQPTLRQRERVVKLMVPRSAINCGLEGPAIDSTAGLA
jgi:Salmonella virulence plasmid 65kDa B protein